MSRFWAPVVRSLTPYTPGEQPRGDNLLKLNTNENAFPPSDAVMTAITSTSGEELLRYPDPLCSELRVSAAQVHGIDPSQVFAGNGSDEVLAHVFQALLKHGKAPLLMPDISYSFYPVWTQLFDVDYRTVPLGDDFSIRVGDYQSPDSHVLLANPNAPTGMAISAASIRSLLDSSPERLVVIDEAYVDYGAESVVPLIRDYDNLLVVQTLSKSRALAGLRVGFAFGDRSLIEGLERVKDSFNSYPLDLLAQKAATAALNDELWFQRTRDEVIRVRTWFESELRHLGFSPLPSQANFVFAEHSVLEGRLLFDRLRERGIIVRRWDKPRIENYLRISIGTEEQMQRVRKALAEIVGDALETPGSAGYQGQA
ncbi:MAG: histidinol-phosphate transaminase [Pseudomonadota bacterium]